MSAPDGLLVVDKPAGWTSHDVVARVRRLARTRKVGHAGTLDPMATGVLLLGLGRATRLLGHLALTDKDYDARVRLGETTVTDDAEGELVSRRDPSGVGEGALLAALAALTGEVDQVPSAVSAVKVGGVRSYARVRAGQDVALPPRRVTVSRLQLLARRGPDLELAVTCSSGTYVRALARDLGEALGVGAHLTALRRTRVGPFGLAQAHELAALATAEDAPVDAAVNAAVGAHAGAHAGAPAGTAGGAPVVPSAAPVDAAVVPLADAVAAAFAVRRLDDAEATALSHGRRLAPSGTSGTVGAFAPDGRCVALLEDRGGAARPTVVFAPAGG